MVLPTAYWGPVSYFQALHAHRGNVEIEQWESFEKQTFRNRCVLHNPDGSVLTLIVPVCKAEHKQPTRDVRISYQQHWQHQHWTALTSTYRHTPYFRYYEDYFRIIYETNYTYLLDLNEALSQTVLCLIDNQAPATAQTPELPRTTAWSGQTWTDRHVWQHETGIADMLFEYGPQIVKHLRGLS